VWRLRCVAPSTAVQPLDHEAQTTRVPSRVQRGARDLPCQAGSCALSHCCTTSSVRPGTTSCSCAGSDAAGHHHDPVDGRSRSTPAARNPVTSTQSAAPSRASRVVPQRPARRPAWLAPACASRAESGTTAATSSPCARASRHASRWALGVWRDGRGSPRGPRLRCGPRMPLRAWPPALEPPRRQWPARGRHVPHPHTPKTVLLAATPQHSRQRSSSSSRPRARAHRTPTTPANKTDPDAAEHGLPALRPASLAALQRNALSAAAQHPGPPRRRGGAMGADQPGVMEAELAQRTRRAAEPR
jgi:hypothetical protein